MTPAHDGSRPISGSRDRDLLSQLFANVRLNGHRLISYAPSASFSIELAGTGALHMVEHGELELVLPGHRRLERLARGDVVLLPRGGRHQLRGPAGADSRVGKAARWLSGTFTIGDSDASPWLARLPEIMRLDRAPGRTLEGPELAKRMLLDEMNSPSQGADVMIARILDLLVIQLLRAWAADRDGPASWLAAAIDPQIGLAVTSIHGDPDQGWTVDRLARLCNLSRSRFSERFSERVGTPPSRYLTLVRLGAAAQLLRDTSTPVGVVARRVGYTSEPGFSRAFRAQYGSSPARWRSKSSGTTNCRGLTPTGPSWGDHVLSRTVG